MIGWQKLLVGPQTIWDKPVANPVKILTTFDKKTHSKA
jgi:hypothetical protein